MVDKIISLGISKTEALELVKVSKDIDKDYSKLKNKYPIQYLIGYVNFYGNRINVNEDVLIPRYETEYLVEKIIKRSKLFNEKIKVLDLCTGSGAIAISLKKELNCEVDASDISENALKIAQINADINNCNINYIKSNLFEKITSKYNIIISNPPYISKEEIIMESVYKYEPHLALFAEDDGLYFYKKILKDIKKYLKEKFIIAFEIGCLQGNKLKLEASKYFKNENIFIEKDLSGKDRYLIITS